MSSSSLIFYSAMFNLLLVPSNVFFFLLFQRLKARPEMIILISGTRTTFMSTIEAKPKVVTSVDYEFHSG